LIDKILRAVRYTDTPFGGIKVILTGDFFQLPPVVPGTDIKRWPDLKEPFCFQSPLWKEAGFESIELTKNWRQNDSTLLQVLSECRTGKLSAQSVAVLHKRIRAFTGDGIKSLRLCPCNDDVHTINRKELAQLPGEETTVKASFYGHPSWIDAIKKEMICDESLTLKEGAQVMLLTNDPEGEYVNGSMATMETLPTEKDSPRVELLNGSKVRVEPFLWEKIDYGLKDNKLIKNPLAAVQQLPMKLAYASTIHKSQGLTLDRVEMDVAKCFAPGQAYVALSRVRTLEGLSLRTFSTNAIFAHPAVKAFYGQLT